MKSPTDDLENRRPVWSALAALFLDTDPAATLASRARTLAESPYAAAELEQVLLCEVLPVCRANLVSPAGEWAGFDDGWLEARILEAVRKRRGPWSRFVARRFAASKEWAATRDEVARLRNSPTG